MTRHQTGRWLFFFLPLIISPLAHADDWPTVGHDNQRTGVTREVLRPPLEQIWRFKPAFPPAPGWSLPVNGYGARKNKPNVSHDDAPRIIAVGDRCYFSASGEHRIIALRATDGRLQWSYPTDAAARLAPAYWRGRLYVGADDGVFRCLDASDGTVAWQINAAPQQQLVLGQGRFTSNWPIRAAGMVQAGIVYFTAGLFPYNHVYFYAVHASDGSIRWCQQLDRGGRLDHVPQGYILAASDSLFTTSRTAPARWSSADGTRVDFETPFPDVPKSHEYRFYNGGSDARIWHNRYIVYGQACILAYNPDGQRTDRWGRKQQGELLFNWFNARQILFDNDTAYLATDDYLLAVPQDRLPQLAAGACREFEETYKRLRVASYLDVRDKHARLVRKHGADHPKVRRLEQGPLHWGSDNWAKWQEAKPKLIARIGQQSAWLTSLEAHESLILSGNVIYAGGEDAVYALEASDGKRLWQHTTGARVRDLAVANGRLFVSCVDGRVLCFAPPAEPTDQRYRLTTRRVAGHEGEPTVAVDAQPAAGRSPAENQSTVNLSADSTEFKPDAVSNHSWLDPLLDDPTLQQGYCLIAGATDVRLATHLAATTTLRVELTAAPGAEVAAMRQELIDAGVYGGRVCVRAMASKRLPYPPYLFNLVIDAQAVGNRRGATTAKANLQLPLQELFRITKPCGGVLCLPPPPADTERSKWDKQLEALAAKNATLRRIGDRCIVTRGPIPKTTDWTHNYATAANTYCSEDPHVRGPFGLLWYGEPGPRKRIDRHATPPMPLVSQGILFTIGYDLVAAYDLYNGHCYWEREIAGATREHLPINTSNLAADQQSLFVVVDGGRCLRLDARTGKTLAEYSLPQSDPDRNAGWAWIAVQGDILYGSRAEQNAARRQPQEQTSDLVFALHKQSGDPIWVHEGAGIDHDGIAVADGLLFLIDRNLSAQQHEAAFVFPAADDSVPGRPAVDRRGQPISRDVRKLVALDAQTGQPRWVRPLDLTDVTLDDRVVQGRGGVACMAKDGVVVVHGTASLGHPHQEFLKGEFGRRAMYVFRCADGEPLWGGRKGYRKRPIIAGDYVYAEPFAWHLQTGQPKTIANPLSGRQQRLDFHRGYIGCGHILASGKALFGAKGGIAYCNLDDAAGFHPFDGVDLACGLGAVPAGGVLAVPEGRAGCTCDVPIHTSLVLYPRPDGQDWSVGMTGGRAPVVSLPVAQVSINLGAPGYHQDEHGNLWIPYPARLDTGPIGDWLPTYQHDRQMCYEIPRPIAELSGTDQPWLYRYGYRHDKPLRFRLLEEGDSPGRYTVRLFFAEPAKLAAGQRLLTVRLQGRPVLESFDIVPAAGGARRGVMKEFSDIQIDGELEIQVKVTDDSRLRQPVLCGLQAIRQPAP